MPAATLVSITGAGIPDDFLSQYAARGLVMSLAPIDAAVRQRRTINGELKDVSRAQFRNKREAELAVDGEGESPPFTDVAPGTIATVVCLPHLGTRGENTDGSPRQIALIMMVGKWGVRVDEWGAAVGWSLPLLEV